MVLDGSTILTGRPTFNSTRGADPMGGIVITNDGHCILREVDVSHPAAKSMIELSRAQVGQEG